MKLLLLSATILAGFSASAWATSINDLEIDVGTSGSVKTLVITQETSTLGNLVGASTSGTSGSNALPVTGAWATINVSQAGGNSKLTGALTASTSSTGTGYLLASYTGGSNTHKLTIGTTTQPVDPTLNITVAGASNTITDVLDGTALSYTLDITGASNTVHNTVASTAGVTMLETITGGSNSLTNNIAATGAITLNQGGGSYGITGSSNTIDNEVSGVTSFTHNLTVSGSSNYIYNTVSGSGATSLTQDIQSGSNSITTNLTGGAQTASLTVDSASLVTYTQTSSGLGSNATVVLDGVTGSSGAAVVTINQTGAGASANLTVNGNSYAIGSSLTGGAGIYVSQSTANAVLNATVAANAAAYTVKFTQ